MTEGEDDDNESNSSTLTPGPSSPQIIEEELNDREYDSSFFDEDSVNDYSDSDEDLPIHRPVPPHRKRPHPPSDVSSDDSSSEGSASCVDTECTPLTTAVIR